jgi:hypothetical protein
MPNGTLKNSLRSAGRAGENVAFEALDSEGWDIMDDNVISMLSNNIFVRLVACTAARSYLF